jgi:hypothetical protein
LEVRTKSLTKSVLILFFGSLAMGQTVTNIGTLGPGETATVTVPVSAPPLILWQNSANTAVKMCKKEGDKDCVTVLGTTELKTIVGPLTITDGFQTIATIDKDGVVTVSENIDPEYVIRMMAQGIKEQSQQNAERNQELEKGWRATLNTLDMCITQYRGFVTQTQHTTNKINRILKSKDDRSKK